MESKQETIPILLLLVLVPTLPPSAHHAKILHLDLPILHLLVFVAGLELYSSFGALLLRALPFLSQSVRKYLMITKKINS